MADLKALSCKLNYEFISQINILRFYSF